MGWCSVINDNYMFIWSRFSLACVRKSLNLCPVIPPRNEVAVNMLSLPMLLVRDFLLLTFIYPQSSTNILMIHYNIVHEPVSIVDSFLQDIRAISWKTHINNISNIS